MLISATLGGLLFALTWRHHLDFGDEGFFWYGAQRAWLGEVPLRDFMSYDPGRYYWTAAVMSLLDDDGIFPARLAAAAFQWIGISLATTTIVRASGVRGYKRSSFTVGVAFMLWIWCRHYYKAFDYAAAMIVVAAGSMLWMQFNLGRWLIAGATIGLLAVFGRHHGVYGFLATLVIAGLMVAHGLPVRAFILPMLAWTGGALAGYLPMGVLAATKPGFATAMWESVVFMFSHGSTNLPRQVPWPWAVDLTAGWLPGIVADSALGVGFIAILAVPIVGVTMSIRTRRPSNSAASGDQPLSGTVVGVWMSCLSAAIPYAHYAFARADLTHLTLGIVPAAMAMVCWPSIRSEGGRFVMLVSSIAFALLVVGIPKFYSQTYMRPSHLAIGGSKLFVSREVEHRFLALSQIAGARPALDGPKFLALPNFMTLHAAWRMPMPVWAIYPLFPRSPSFDRTELERVRGARVEVIIISNHSLDNDTRLQYRSLHPISYQGIAAEYSGSTIRIDSDLEVEVFRPRQSLGQP